MKSIMHEKDGTCYICMKYNGDWTVHGDVEEHHIFMGPRRKLSEKFGLKVYLCPYHHTRSLEAVHVNYETCRQLQAEGQQAFERAYPDKDFLKIFGKNYK